MLEHFGSVLEQVGFIDPANPGQTLTRLRRMFTRMEADGTEVQMFRGILTHLSRAQGNTGESG